eukprot:4833897-Amphidinium_carterae.1
MDGSSVPNQPVLTIPIGIAMNPREEDTMSCDSCPTSVIGSTIPRDQTAPRPMSTLSDPRLSLQEPAVAAILCNMGSSSEKRLV